MIAAISVADFDKHREIYRNLRLNVLNHQPSGVIANDYDLNIFSQYLQDRSIKKITGESILSFLIYLRNERDNQAGAINRKESSL